MHTKFSNRLITESSPYLQQHAHNPVDWYAWGEEALLKAKLENKVILVSIGYSACHWCHVMERESFENESIAAIMNEHFVNIKIDREERPDLDHIYMDAVQAITGSGGWPLNVFLTPDAKPFFGGTYFPPQAAFNRSSWGEVLHNIIKAWLERKDEILLQAENLTDHLQKANNFHSSNLNINQGESLITIEECDSMFSSIMRSADSHWGGFGKAPKFPQTFTIQYLFQYFYFTGNRESLAQALLSIDGMLYGGIYDQVGGGLARYSTDQEWLAPHFEKMLYDNALFLDILCDAFQLTSFKKYENAIRKTIFFVIQDLLNKDGGFYSALDADSEGEEGKYYVWQKTEIEELLGSDSALFCSYYDISESGNWEGKNILRIIKPLEDFIKEKGLKREQFTDTINLCLQKLLVERNKRIRPSLDDKIILGWNALLIKAIAKSAIVLQDKELRSLAETHFNFLIANFYNDNSLQGLLHTYKNGKASYTAFLDDYAYLISSCIQLYKATFNTTYLKNAYKFCNYVIDNYSDEDIIFFYYTHQAQKDIIVRKKEIYDGAIPSGNAIMTENLYQLSIIFERTEWKERADKMLKILSPTVIKYPGSFAVWSSLLLQQLKGLNEVVIIGTDFETLSNNLLLKFIPNNIIMASATENTEFTLLKNRPYSKATLIYLCKNNACMPPFENVNLLLTQIDKTNKITR